MTRHLSLAMSALVLVAPWTLRAAACFAQADASTLTQVSLQCGPGDRCTRYENVGAKLWIQRDAELAQPVKLTETGRSSAAVSLAAPDPRNAILGTKVNLDVKAMMMSGSVVYQIDTRNTAGASFLGSIARTYGISSDGAPETCAALGNTPQDIGARCTCDLRLLHPLQGAVGQAQVSNKTEDIRAQKLTRFDLAYDPIKVVRGPGGLLYVVDHHHAAKAWLDSGAAMGTCVIQTQLISTDPKQFWADVKKHNLVWLEDQNGQAITEQQLPAKLADLPDDPYRTLAWKVRKKDGFCRALMNGQTEFAEFKWADYFRARPELPIDLVKGLEKSTITIAVQLAKLPAAASLPGYRGDKPNGYKCPPAAD